jgi:hypothetical protein
MLRRSWIGNEALADSGIKRITRRPARSGVVDFSTPLTLHESARSRIQLVPYYIHHDTRDDELACKLVRETKQPVGWVEAQSISLDEDAVAKLQDALENHSAVARFGTQGRVYVIQESRLTAETDADPEALAEAVGWDSMNCWMSLTLYRTELPIRTASISPLAVSSQSLVGFIRRMSQTSSRVRRGAMAGSRFGVGACGISLCHFMPGRVGACAEGVGSYGGCDRDRGAARRPAGGGVFHSVFLMVVFW